MKCPICESSNLKKISITTQEARGKLNMRLERCRNCGVIFAEDYKTSRKDVYNENYAAWNNFSGFLDSKEINLAKKRAFRDQLKELYKIVRNPKGKAVLDIGAGGGHLLECAQEAGFDCYGTEVSPSAVGKLEKTFPGKIKAGDIANGLFSKNYFDIIFMTDVLEHLSDPKRNIEEISKIIKPGGYLFIISPNTDSWTRKIFRSKWFQYKYEHLFYFNRPSLSTLLLPYNFQEVVFKNNRKNFSLHYYAAYFQKYSFWGVGSIVSKSYPYLPAWIQNISFSNPITGEFISIYRKKSR